MMAMYSVVFVYRLVVWASFMKPPLERTSFSKGRSFFSFTSFNFHTKGLN